MTQLLGGRLDAIRPGFAGDILTPGDDGYESGRSLWNAAFDRKPEVIARCATDPDVAAAIAFARAEGLEIAVRGGGHSFSGVSVGDGGLTINLSRMNHVLVDPIRRRALCGGGAMWGTVDVTTQVHGLAVPGGIVSHTGIGGLTLGGGMGWLLNEHGLTIDNLVAAKVVTADGRTLRASETSHPELFWALRGGGGNFGVVTEFEFELHPMGPMVQLGMAFWPVAATTEALHVCRDTVLNLPPRTGALLAGVNAPPAPFVSPEHHFVPGVALLLAGFGDPGEHAELLQSACGALPPLFQFAVPMPYTQLQQLLDPSGPWGTHSYARAVALDDLTDGAIGAIAEHLPRKNAPTSLSPIFPTVGAYAAHSDDETAFGGRRSSRFTVGIGAEAPTAELCAADRVWAKDYWDALVPHAGGTGSYVNFMAEYEEDRIVASYGREKFDRLARIKAEYDPDNVFHLNANIKPATG